MTPTTNICYRQASNPKAKDGHVGPFRTIPAAMPSLRSIQKDFANNTSRNSSSLLSSTLSSDSSVDTSYCTTALEPRCSVRTVLNLASYISYIASACSCCVFCCHTITCKVTDMVCKERLVYLHTAFPSVGCAFTVLRCFCWFVGLIELSYELMSKTQVVVTW